MTNHINYCINVQRTILNNPFLFLPLMKRSTCTEEDEEDGQLEGHVCIFSCENSKIATCCWTSIDRRMLDPTKIDTPRSRAKEKPQQDGRKDKITFRFKCLICQRHSCMHQNAETPQRLTQTCLWVFKCLLWRRGSAVACCRDRGSGCSRPGSHSMWHKPSWRKSPLVPP